MASLRSLPTTIVSLLTLISVLAFLFLAWSVPAMGADAAETLVLVARPAVRDRLYGQSILLARELPGGQHVGFILNKPTELKLTEAFPGNEASKSVTTPLYLGGPSDMSAVFALVHNRATLAEGAADLLPIGSRSQRA